MNELKATTAQEIIRNEKDCDYMDELFGGVKMPPTQVYLKSEADKVIAELKEENEKLKATPEQIMKEVFDKCLIYPKEMVRLDDAYKLAVSLRKQKYKRCLGKAQEWRNYAAFCEMQSHCHNHRGFGKTAEKYTRKECHGWKCVKRWLKIAEQFKDKEA